jgi:signal transduction histidine kinase
MDRDGSTLDRAGLPSRLARDGLWIVLWTSLGLFFSTQSYLLENASGRAVDFGDALRWTMPVWYAFGLLTPLIFWYDRRLEPDLDFKRRILRHLPFALVWTLAYMTIRTVAQRLLVGPYISLTFSGIAMQFHYAFLNYFLFGGVYAAYRYYRESREQQVRASALEARLSDARLDALRARLQPHFLFNALNTVSAYVERDPATSRRMLDHLSTLLRKMLDHGNRQLTPLADELGLLDHYLSIQKVRFGDQLTVNIDVDRAAQRALVPPLLLQPIVENAVRHGIARTAGAGRLDLVVWREDRHLNIRVIDNGPGVVEAAAPEPEGYGLSITRERLATLYGADYRLSIDNAEDGGAVVAITLPFQPTGDRADG